MVPGKLRGFDRQTMCDVLKATGTNVSRYGLVIVLLWIGGMKFTAYEAEGIRPMVANSPLMSWAYGVMSQGAFSALLGVIEIATGLLIALRPVWPLGSAVGSGLAVGTFLTTLTFLFTTPGWEASLGGFPALSHMPGSFCSRISSCWEPPCLQPAKRWQRPDRVAVSKGVSGMAHIIHKTHQRGRVARKGVVMRAIRSQTAID